MIRKNHRSTRDKKSQMNRELFFVVGSMKRYLSRHNRPPAKNVRPSKTEKERGRRWRMVHSGPFNGLCEIESSRGSPGISNIFLSMLLRTASPSHLPVIPPSAWLLHISPSSLSYVTIQRRQHILIDPRNLRQDIAASCERFAADANRFPNFRETVETLERNVTRILFHAAYHFRSGCRRKGREVLIVIDLRPIKLV